MGMPREHSAHLSNTPDCIEGGCEMCSLSATSSSGFTQ